MNEETLRWITELQRKLPLTESIVFKLRNSLIALERATDKGELLALFYSLMPEGGYSISKPWATKVLTKLCDGDNASAVSKLATVTLIGLKSVKRSWYVVPTFRVTTSKGSVIECTLDKDKVEVYRVNESREQRPTVSS